MEAFFLILRRLRRPILLIVVSFAISVLGLANIPGIEVNGEPTTLGYFYAFYVMSYTATTIGYGEMPVEFSDAQRAWVMVSIYISVICWGYGLGSVMEMLRDPAFRMALTRGSFASSVRRIAEPFVLIVGYGRSGTVLAHMLDRIGYRSVVVDSNETKVAQISLQEFQHAPLSITADGCDPEILVDAGVTHPQCETLVAIAGDDETTQAVAISGTALNPSLRIIARARSEMAASNLESFNKIELVNPFESFAFNLGQAFSAPEKLQLEDWLTGIPGAARPEVMKPPKGHWIICGFGRFGQYIASALTRAGVPWTAIDPTPTSPDRAGLLKKPYSQETLLEADIEHAAGIVACTDSDAINFSAVKRARSLNPKLFVVVRQVKAANAALVESSSPDSRFNQEYIMSHEVRQLITSPLLKRFLRAVRNNQEDLVAQTTERLVSAVGERVPYLWVFSAMAAYPGLREAFAWNYEAPFRVGDLLIHPLEPSRNLSATALMLVREDKEILLPESHFALRSGDRILFAGAKNVQALQRLHYYSPTPLTLMRTGKESPRSWFFSRLLPKLTFVKKDL
ncbi:MAG: NAD-binding protein [Burkholderiales bacterium]|nr:NAD-binding protein [Burkholderiales bacterium]